MEIRSGRAGDAQALLDFWQAAAHGTSVSDDLDGVTRLLVHDPESVLIAETADGRSPGREIVGTLIAGWDGWRCHLYRLAVRPGHRRRGIGRALLAEAERRFADLGGRRIDALVDDGNADAHAFYRRAGYEQQGDWSRWVRRLPAGDVPAQ